jgi:dolichol-phosphate mannosyltransferase
VLSIVIPAYNEEGVIGRTLNRIAATPDLGDFEVVVVSDGSTDGTFEEARAAMAGRLRGTVLDLATNVGSHAAIRCGLQHAEGDHVAVLSADGQDPPEQLAAMLHAFKPGIDIVWGQRRDRSSDGLVARTLARLYYRLFRRLTSLDYPPSGLDFVVVSRRVVATLDRYRERHASLFLLIYNLGFGQTTVPYDRGERIGGQSGWTLRKRTKLAIDMVTAFSAAPIRLISLVGIVVGLAGLGFGGVTLIRGFLGQVPVSGWASMMVLTSLLMGLTLVAVGFLGEYVWRALDEIRGRPLYIETRSVAVDTSDTSGPPKA